MQVIASKNDIETIRDNENYAKKAMNFHDTYFIEQKIRVFNELVKKGYNGEAVKNFIDMHGIPENGHEEWWIKTHLNNPGFINPLKM